MDGEVTVCRKRTTGSASGGRQRAVSRPASMANASRTALIPKGTSTEGKTAPQEAPPAAASVAPEGEAAGVAAVAAVAAEVPAFPGPVRKWTAKVRTAFLEALAELGQVRAAARAAGVSPQLVYRERQKNPDFAREWQEAMDRALDALEETLLDRAINGVEKQVYYGGKSCGSVRQYSDALAMFLLRARRPETYGRAVITEAQPPAASTSGQGDPVALIEARLRKLAGQEAGRDQGVNS